jgi:PAS domain S-box-containing protein
MNKDSDNKLSKPELQEALACAENIISTLREPLLVLDDKLRVISANRSFYRVFSITQEETQDKLIYEMADGQWNIPKLRGLLEAILNTNAAFDDFEFDHEFPGLGKRFLLLNARRVNNGGANTKKILLAIEDISERKRIEHDMVASELRYRRLFETAQDGILILNAKSGKITDINPFLLKMLGYSKADLFGKKLWELGFFIDADASRQAFDVLQKKGYVRYEDLPLKTKSGKPMQVEFVSNVYQIDGEKVIQCNIRDITERKLNEAKISRLNEKIKQRAAELEVANKELEAFSYTVSHDLQTPLRSMNGFSQALFEDYPDRLDDQGKDYLKFIQESSKRMSQMIGDILRLSQITRSEIKKIKVNLSGLAQSVVEELEKAEPDRRVKFLISPGIKVKGDRRLLQIVLENLLGNAWKFTQKVKNPVIEFGTLTNGKGQSATTYFVRDNGVGFNEAYTEKLFLPFQRLHSKQEYAGTGIGLASVQRVIKRHGGRIWATSKEGEGAAFFFTLE